MCTQPIRSIQTRLQQINPKNINNCKALAITKFYYLNYSLQLQCTSIQFTLNFSLPSTFGRFVFTLQKPLISPHIKQYVTCMAKFLERLQAVGSTV